MMAGAGDSAKNLSQLEESLKIWEIHEPKVKVRQTLAGELDVSELVAQLLINRGITETRRAREFLKPSLADLHDPFSLAGMREAIHRIERGLENKEKICIYGDFDVDGVSGTALLISVLQELGAETDFYIPNRLTEGYGLNKKALGLLKKKGIQLVITVDCGITAVAEASFCKKAGLDLIITDHHEPGKQLPSACALINPKISPEYPFKELAGVGVAFKLGQALISARGTRDSLKILEKCLDLVALGTVADVVPLLDENRILVCEGLKRIGRTTRPGLRALLEVAGLRGKRIQAGQVAYCLAPRLNAGGRLGEAGSCVELLTTEERERAEEIADALERRNRERKSIEEKIYREAVARVEEQIDLREELVILLHSGDWHEGVKGIVASKLVDRFRRPTFLFTAKKEEALGSARSIPGFHLSEVLAQVEDLLLSYGGHALAAGLKVHPCNLEELRFRLNKIARERLQPEDLTPKVRVDCDISLSEINYQLLKELEWLAPHGTGNPVPVLVSHGVSLNGHRLIGNGKHLRFTVEDGGCLCEGVAFNIDKNFSKVMRNYQSSVDLAYQLERNVWQGKESIQLKLVDIQPNTKPKADDDPWLENLFSNSHELIRAEDYKNIGDSECFYTKVVGVTFEDRQQALAEVREGTGVELVREPDNPHDPNAIKILHQSGLDLGYINARLAKQLAPYLDQGFTYEGLVTPTGGEEKNRGLNVEIRRKAESLSLPARKRTAERGKLARLPDDQLISRLEAEFLGSAGLREKQRESLDCLLSGKNCLTIMGTGRGKSLIFYLFSAVKAIKDNGFSIIVFPLRALVNDQYHHMSQAFERVGLVVARMTGDADGAHRQSLFRALEEGGVDAVLTTPEFLYHHQLKFGKIKKRLSFFVADECHHICTSSQAHRPLYKKLQETIGEFGNPLVLAATATANDEVAGEICGSLGIESIVVDPTVRSNLKIVDQRGIGRKEEYLKRWIGKGHKSVVYVNSREQSVQIASFLRSEVPHLRNRIVYYNAGLNKEARNIIEERFRSGEFLTVVATSAFGEGVNIPDISHLFFYHLNFNFIEFNQQSGRAGRSGENAFIHLLFGEEDARINQLILESTAPSRENLAELYRVLRRCGERKNGSVPLNNEELVYELELSLGRSPLNEKGIGAGIKILEELGLIQIGGSGSYREIRLQSLPTKRINLEQDSVRYEEGMHEKEMFENFKNWVLKSSSDELLEMINRPIYPRAWAKV
jgi:single-stranded-DNA-specific exonuclease